MVVTVRPMSFCCLNLKYSLAKSIYSTVSHPAAPPPPSHIRGRLRKKLSCKNCSQQATIEGTVRRAKTWFVPSYLAPTNSCRLRTDKDTNLFFFVLIFFTFLCRWQHLMIKRHGKHDFEPCDCWDNWTSLQNPNTNRRIIQVVRAQEGQNLGREVWSKKEEEAEGRCFDAHRRERGCWKGFEVTLLFLGPIIGRTGGFSSPRIWSKILGFASAHSSRRKKNSLIISFFIANYSQSSSLQSFLSSCLLPDCSCCSISSLDFTGGKRGTDSENWNKSWDKILYSMIPILPDC